MKSHDDTHLAGQQRRFIQFITAAAGPVTQLRDVAEEVGIDAVIRAIDAGLPIYDAGSALLTKRASFDMLRDLMAMGRK